MSYSIEEFLADCRTATARVEDPAERVTEVAPMMQRLVGGVTDFLKPEHFHSDPAHYSRNAVYICPSGNLSLFSIVWLPGQWTPIHDHGSWGVVGVVKGVLEERNYMCCDGEITRDSGIRLKRGGVVLLNPGAVSTFVPNPDHIHMTGVPECREPCVSLHLYGRNMNSFHVYDLEKQTRQLVDVPHYETY